MYKIRADIQGTVTIIYFQGSCTNLNQMTRFTNTVISRLTMLLRLIGSGLPATYDVAPHSMAIHGMTAPLFNSRKNVLCSFASSSCSSVPLWSPISDLHSYSPTQQEPAPNANLTMTSSLPTSRQFLGHNQYSYQLIQSSMVPCFIPI